MTSWQVHFLSNVLAIPQKTWYTISDMKKRETYFVSVKNPLTWIAAILMLGSAGLRIAYFCEKGADTTTMWWLCILPAAAGLIYVLYLLLDSKEHFYRTLLPMILMAVYFAADLVLRGLPNRYVFLNILVFAAFLIFYKQITSGHVHKPWLLPLMFLAALALAAYDARQALTNGSLRAFADCAMLLAGLVTCFAIRLHLDGKYHPTWGDRSDGRRVRTIPAMSRAMPYIMKTRNDACNTFTTEIEISEMEKYIRQKRKEGLTGFGLNHAFIAAYVRCVSQYPQVNRFVSGREVYSRGDDIQYSMTIKKVMSVESPDTCIKLHLKPTDTVYDVYEKFEKAVSEVKDAPDEDNNFDKLAGILSLLPGPVYMVAVKLLEFLDFFGLLPGFLLEISPFHGSVFFTSMGSLGIPAIIHHLYNFGNMPIFISFGKKYRRNEIDLDGNILPKKYVDMGFTLDERICDGFYYAAVLKYLKRIFNDPQRLDNPLETVVEDIP